MRLRSMLSTAVALIVTDGLLGPPADARSGSHSSHSLRSGFLTSAAEAGALVFKMMEVARHKSVDTLRGYVRRADLFREHAEAAFL